MSENTADAVKSQAITAITRIAERVTEICCAAIRDIAAIDDTADLTKDQSRETALHAAAQELEQLSLSLDNTVAPAEDTQTGTAAEPPEAVAQAATAQPAHKAATKAKATRKSKSKSDTADLHKRSESAQDPLGATEFEPWPDDGAASAETQATLADFGADPQEDILTFDPNADATLGSKENPMPYDDAAAANPVVDAYYLEADTKQVWHYRGHHHKEPWEAIATAQAA